jgi:DNA polymerase-3 subunit alpha
MSLFGGLQEEHIEPEIKYPPIKEFEKKYLLAMEKEMTGIYLTGHPLDEYAETIKLQCEINIGDILATTADTTLDEVQDVSMDMAAMIPSKTNEQTVYDGMRVVLGGIISEVSKKYTRNNDMMAFVTLEDLYGLIEVVVFPKVFQKVAAQISPDALILVKGRVSIREDELPKILCEEIQPLVKINTTNVYVQVEDENIAREINKSLRSVLPRFKGNTPLYLCTRKERNKYRMPKEFWVDCNSGVLQYLQQQFGEENVKVL